MKNLAKFSKLTYANFAATLALFIALGGTSYAAITVTGKNFRDGSLIGKDLKNGSVGSSKLGADAKLFGPKGDPGAPGTRGEQGPRGADGSDGADGADGSTGPPGERVFSRGTTTTQASICGGPDIPNALVPGDGNPVTVSWAQPTAPLPTASHSRRHPHVRVSKTRSL